MKEVSDKKEFSTNLKSFTWVGYILVAFGIVYSVSSYFALLARGQDPAKAFSGGVIALIFAGFFFYMGTKKRRFIFMADRFEYKTNKVIYTEQYANIDYIKTFKEKDKETSHLLFLTQNGSEQKLSSAFLSTELVKSVFLELYSRTKSKPEIEIEDELNWLGAETKPADLPMDDVNS